MMKTMTRMALFAVLAVLSLHSQAANVTVAWQTSAEPAKVAQADNMFEKLSDAYV
ncbi:taurine transport system substrate-binding protein [Izhakiella capsodis]|uniref:Taurine transport system substrate-binding protein n=1 Tax=Izhakiella capsodis TaxID=1367852 RepID=A0A1I4Z140_9GAMM|nr:hypothetical protein [Izhakiella capsodis]SFN43974.1 taurine transport system substrate-binding protein [Izhakiella capsodis]